MTLNRYIREISDPKLDTIKGVIETEQLGAKTRIQYIVHQRFFIMNYLRNETSLPLEKIGAMLGGLNHATVLHGVKKHNMFMDWNDEVYLRDIKYIKNHIENPKTIPLSELAEDILKATTVQHFMLIQDELKADKYST